jgi:predicted transcriptional regulator
MPAKKKSRVAPAALRAAWDAIISEQRLDDIDALRAEGWLTVGDYRERAGLSDAAARSKLAAMFGSGVLEKKTARLQTSNGVRVCIMYRPQS